MVAFLAPYAAGIWHWFGLQATLAVLSIVAGLATPALAAVAIDQAVEGRIAWGFFGLAGAMAASALIGTLSGPVASRFGVPLGGRLTRQTVAHALDIGLPGRRPFDDGDLLNRAGSLASQMPGYASTVIRVGTGLAMVAGSLAALLFIHWLFVAVWLVGVGLLALLARRFMAVLSAEQSAYEELNGRMVNAYSDALTGRRTIRAAGTVDREVDRVTQPLPALAETARSILRVMGRAAVVMASADTGVLVATAVAGIWLLAQGDLTPGALLAGVRYAQMAYGSAAGVFDNGWFHIALLRSQAARLMELAATPAMKQGREEPADGPLSARGTPSRSPAEGSLLARGTPSRSPAEGSLHARGSPSRTPAEGSCGDIELDNVSVRGEAEDILRGVNLCIPAGTTIALVGVSGVGKTTLATLVGRLHDPDQGEVVIDGAPVSVWPAEALAQRVAYAFESPALLGDTVRDAITLGYDASDAEVEAAARSVEADAFIRRLPDGYDTALDEAPMSGGERQRLGLARAALRDSPALVLDDALSSLDVATAARIFAALGSLSKDRTAIVVAHRASTAAAADVVAWLVDGRVHTVAPHAELWKDAAYRAAFTSAGALSSEGSLLARGSPSRSPAEGSLHARGSPSRSPAEGSLHARGSPSRTRAEGSETEGG